MTESIYPDEYLEFIRLFNDERFFEAHEVLEALWRRENGTPKPFYQGLIQIAAAFVHLQKGTPAGAPPLYQKAFSHLEPFLPSFSGLDLNVLLTAAHQAIFGHTSFPKIYTPRGQKL